MERSRFRWPLGAALLGLGGACFTLWAWRPAERMAPADRCAPRGISLPMLNAMVLSESDELALPTRLRVVGDYLAVLDAASDSVLHVIDRHRGMWVRSVGRRGRGPGEFEGAWSLEPAGDLSRAVWVYDLPLRRLTLVPLEQGSRSPAGPGRMVHLTEGAVVTGPHWLAPDTIVTPGFFLDARLAVFDSAGRRLGGLGQSRFQASPPQPMQASQAILAAHPERRRFAIANRYVSWIELLEVDGPPGAVIAGPIAVNRDRPSVELDRFAYIDVAATRRHIVALFSGRERKDFGSRASFGACLHVFDWEGAFEGAFRLDSDVLAIATDGEGDFVYALRHDPLPAVVRFALTASAGLHLAANP